MNTNQSYYLIKKNNNLQTIVSLINPYVYSTNDKNEAERIKEQLELKYLRIWPIDFHFDHHEVVCDEEMILFDKYLIDNFGFSFLTEGFDHSQKELNGKILYGKLFPSELTDEQLLKIQNRMNKYHFEIIDHQPNGKSIIVLNPNEIENPLRDGEIYRLTQYFESKEEAQTFMNKLIEEQFDLDGSFMTVGYITEEEITERTKVILESQSDIRYKSRREDYGKKFISDKKLNEIDNGMEILMKLYESVNKVPYQIVELK